MRKTSNGKPIIPLSEGTSLEQTPPTPDPMLVGETFNFGTDRLKKNGEAVSQLSVHIGETTTLPTIQLTDPLVDHDRFTRELKLLKVLERIAMANSLNPIGDIYQNNVTAYLTKQDRSESCIHGVSIQLILPLGNTFRAIESPDSGVMILVIPKRFHEPIKSAIISRKLETIVINVDQLNKVIDNTKLPHRHPYEKTLELVSRAKTAKINDLPSILSNLRAKNIGTHTEERLNNARFLSVNDFKKLAKLRCFKALSGVICARRDEITQFVKNTKPEAFATFVRINARMEKPTTPLITKPLKKVGSLITQIALRDGYLRKAEQNANVILDKTNAETSRATLLCKLIRLANRSPSIPNPNDLSPT